MFNVFISLYWRETAQSCILNNILSPCQILFSTWASGSLKKNSKARERIQLHDVQRVIGKVAFSFESIYQYDDSLLHSYSIRIM